MFQTHLSSRWKQILLDDNRRNTMAATIEAVFFRVAKERQRKADKGVSLADLTKELGSEEAHKKKACMKEVRRLCGRGKFPRDRLRINNLLISQLDTAGVSSFLPLTILERDYDGHRKGGDPRPIQLTEEGVMSMPCSTRKVRPLVFCIYTFLFSVR